jgi:hypothetical protein
MKQHIYDFLNNDITKEGLAAHIGHEKAHTVTTYKVMYLYNGPERDVDLHELAENIEKRLEYDEEH